MSASFNVPPRLRDALRIASVTEKGLRTPNETKLMRFSLALVICATAPQATVREAKRSARAIAVIATGCANIRASAMRHGSSVRSRHSTPLRSRRLRPRRDFHSQPARAFGPVREYRIPGIGTHCQPWTKDSNQWIKARVK